MRLTIAIVLFLAFLGNYVACETERKQIQSLPPSKNLSSLDEILKGFFTNEGFDVRYLGDLNSVKTKGPTRGRVLRGQWEVYDGHPIESIETAKGSLEVRRRGEFNGFQVIMHERGRYKLGVAGGHLSFDIVIISKSRENPNRLDELLEKLVKRHFVESSEKR